MTGSTLQPQLQPEAQLSAARIKPRLRIAIECRIPDIRQGIGTVILSLARTLSTVGSPTQEYTFLVSKELESWLRPYIFGACKLAVRPVAANASWKARLRTIGPLRALIRRLRGQRIPVPVSDGFVEAEAFDVLHFPTQVAYRSAVPSIYQPWDLQHLHYPENFTPEDVRLREALYRTFCREATAVCVTSEWTRQDLIERYRIDADKITVIRWGALFEDSLPGTDLEQARQRLTLPATYFFYPAATWPHKNHELLIRALHHLKTTTSHRAELCFTGAKGQAHDAVLRLARELGVESSLHFLGFVSAEDLSVIYRLSAAMVFPSRFEGYGLPLMEAFHLGTPVLCSSATVLPETGEDGAAYFDPDSPEQLAGLMLRVLTEPAFRRNLIERASAVLQHSTMIQTVQGLQALYETVAASRAPIAD